MEAHLIYQSSYSNKFWKITVAKTSFAVTYGRIGTAGTMRAEDFSSPEACAKEAHRLIGSKLKKGYRPVVAVQHEIEESAMTDSRFWELLEECKEHGRNSLESLEWLASHLSEKSVTDIISFDSFLRGHYSKSYTRDLWAATHIITGRSSEDGFSHSRTWMLSLGKDTYYGGIADPESLLPQLMRMKEQGEFPQMKDMLLAASKAYEEKTGNDLASYVKLYNQLMEENYSAGDTESIWGEQNKETLRTMFPKLWVAFREDPI